ncbi:hypothetical protein HK405_000002 [Cladochytrium tenue]|nr:hypothetical protein HK405_000002 [Cladochytrium tenue]
MGEVTPPTFKKPGPVEVAPPAEIKKPQVAPPALEKKDGGVGGSGEAAAEGSDGKKMGEVTPPAFKKPGPVKVAPPTEVKKPQIAPPELEKKEGGRGGYEA